ncbi:hypothetical protein RhiirC2_807192 [Rhizophagus irregularis]|uniref:CCHC-type domain-containing protein n=1 Tax=Rhizophagus irregularis TaxID=588596 RepID=A0A2N1P2U9_9GLOM|nr:hypothetical protein RhiirC2_807192 [Rhizophagus irregularis]
MSYTTRSSTSKNNKKNIQKQNKNTQQNTNIDETIVEDTYSTRKLSDDETPNPRPSKIRATHIEDNNNTNDNNPDDMDINEENTHSLSNSEMDISSHDQIKKNKDQTPINNEQDSMETDQHNHNQDNTNTPDQHSIKGKAKINNDDILHLSNIFDKEKSRDNQTHEAFIPKDSFNNNLTDKEIKERIKNAFITERNAIKFNTRTSMNYTYFTITFTSRDSMSQYLNKPIQLLGNSYIYELTQENINTLILNKLQRQDKEIITTTIKETTIENSPYKQLIVQFMNDKAVEYLISQDQWGIQIEDFYVRIVPGNPKHEEYIKRTSHYYKITGLPLNTNIFDIQPLYTYLKGKTCTFTVPNKFATSKNAFIYIDKQDIKEDFDQIKSIDFMGFKIFLYSNSNPKQTCTICGTFKHKFQDCDDTNFFTDKNNRKIYRKRLLTKNNIKITINEETRDTYNHVIRLQSKSTVDNINDTNQIQTQQKTKPTNNQNNTFNKDNDNHTRHKSQEGHYNPSTSHTTPTMNEKLLLEKICTLENSIKDLQIEINNLNKNQIEMNQKIQTNKSNIDICMNAQTQFNEKQDENNRIVNNINNNVNKLVEKISTNFSSITNTNIDQYTPQCPTPYHNIPYDNIKSIALSKTKDNENISQDEYYETESNYSSGSNTITEHIVEPDADANPSNYSFGKVLSTINLFHGNNKNNNNTRW